MLKATNVVCLLIIASAVCNCAPHLTTLNGELVQVIDNCTVGSSTGCHTSHCCVREGLVFLPGSVGPKPSYKIVCKQYRRRNELCIPGPSDEFCPCDPALNCTSSGAFFGRCH